MPSSHHVPQLPLGIRSRRNKPPQSAAQIPVLLSSRLRAQVFLCQGEDDRQHSTHGNSYVTAYVFHLSDDSSCHQLRSVYSFVMLIASAQFGTGVIFSPSEHEIVVSAVETEWLVPSSKSPCSSRVVFVTFYCWCLLTRWHQSNYFCLLPEVIPENDHVQTDPMQTTTSV